MLIFCRKYPASCCPFLSHFKLSANGCAQNWYPGLALLLLKSMTSVLPWEMTCLSSKVLILSPRHTAQVSSHTVEMEKHLSPAVFQPQASRPAPPLLLAWYRRSLLPGCRLPEIRHGPAKGLQQVLFGKYGKSLRHFKRLNTYRTKVHVTWYKEMYKYRDLHRAALATQSQL